MIPSYARFQSGGKAVAAPSTRRTVRVFPDAGPSNYNPDNNSVIRIELSPSLGFLDTVNSYLSFRVKPGAGVNLAKECRMDRNSMSWVQNMTIYSSTGAVLERLEDYNLLVNLLHKATTPEDYRSSVQQMIDNSGDKSVRNAAMAHRNGSKFNSGFDCSGILGGQTKLLPCSYFQGPLVIELQLAPFQDCFVGTAMTSGDNRNLSYELMDVCYHAQVLTFGEDYNSKMSQQVRSRGVDISFDTYKRHETRLIGNSIDTSISQNAASVKGVYHVLRDKEQYRNATYDSLSTYKSGLLKEVQWDLGSKQYPEFPLKLDNDGYTDLYSQNLMSFNMFRNLSLGSEVDDTNFATCNPAKEALGLHSAAFKALPVRRIYGKWVVNSGDVFDPDKLDRKFSSTGNLNVTLDAGMAGSAAVSETVSAAVVGGELATLLTIASTPNRITKTYANGAANPYTTLVLGGKNVIFYAHTVDTLHFVPSDPKDAHLIQSGMKCKLGVPSVPVGESSVGSAGEVNLGEYGIDNLAEQDYGLDRFYASEPGRAFDVGDATGGNKSENYLPDSKAVMYPGTPTHITWGHTKGYADEKYTALSGGALANKISAMHVSGLAVPFVDGLNRAICCKAAGGHVFEGWVEILPDDSSFFVGCSMESHPEENFSMVSGADLTNMTPLHVRLEYESTPTAGESFYAPKNETDPFTTFVHVDSVLRLQPDGTLISSV